MKIEDFLGRLEGIKPSKSGWTAKCPAHEDQRNSFSVREGKTGKILIRCFAGCPTDSIDTALGITWKDRMPPREGTTKPTRREVCAYDYKDETGTLLFQNVRYDPKDFLQRCPDGKGGWVYKMTGVRRVIYKLPELMAAP